MVNLMAVQVTDPSGRRNFGGNVNMRNLNLAMVNPVSSRGEKRRNVKRRATSGRRCKARSWSVAA